MEHFEYVDPVVDLLYNDDTDTSTIDNVMLISDTVSDHQIFVDSANANTFPIVYSYYSDSSNLLQLLLTKFTHIQRISFVFHDPLNRPKTFLDAKPFFTDDDLILGQTTFSDNVTFLQNLISQFTVSKIDFLACNSLLYDNWKTYYQLITDTTTVIVGASDNLSGNIKYGADWVMENTNEDIKIIYFNDNIDDFSGYLAEEIDEVDYQIKVTAGIALIDGPRYLSKFNWIIPDDVSYNGISYNVTGFKINNNNYDSTFKDNTFLSGSLTIGNNIQSVPNIQFQGCINLKSVICNFASVLTSIDSSAFSDCTGLTTIALPNNLQQIGDSGFRGCTELTSVSIPASVTHLNRAFDECDKLTTVVIADVENCTSVNRESFYDIKSIQSSSITFYGVENYNSFPTSWRIIKEYYNKQYYYYVPNTSYFDYTFLVNPPGVRVDGSNSNTNESVNMSIPHTFMYSSNMEGNGTGSIPQRLTYDVTEIADNAFMDNTDLSGNFTIGNKVTKIGDNAFKNCINLTSVTIPTNVTYIGDSAFDGCSSLTEVVIENQSLITTVNINSFTDVRYNSSSSITFYNTNSINDLTDEWLNISQSKFFKTIYYTTPIVCFNTDSKILTDKGYIPIQNLKKGDLIKTLRHGYIPINMIGKREIHNPALKHRIKDQLYKCSPDEYPEIFEPLIITGCHCILVDDFISEEQRKNVIDINKHIYVTDHKYRLPACADPRTTIYETSGKHTIYHLALDNDDYYMNYGIFANGLLVETTSKRYLKELSNMDLIE